MFHIFMSTPKTTISIFGVWEIWCFTTVVKNNHIYAFLCEFDSTNSSILTTNNLTTNAIICQKYNWSLRPDDKSSNSSEIVGYKKTVTNYEYQTRDFNLSILFRNKKKLNISYIVVITYTWTFSESTEAEMEYHFLLQYIFSYNILTFSSQILSRNYTCPEDIVAN